VQQQRRAFFASSVNRRLNRCSVTAERRALLRYCERRF
jgi:hypothetical protein